MLATATVYGVIRIAHSRMLQIRAGDLVPCASEHSAGGVHFQPDGGPADLLLIVGQQVQDRNNPSNLMFGGPGISFLGQFEWAGI